MTDSGSFSNSPKKTPSARLCVPVVGMMVFALTAAVLALATAGSASAQEGSVVELADELDPVDVDEDEGLDAPADGTLDIPRYWRYWRDSLADGDPDVEDLEQLRERAVSSGRPALPHHQLAVLHEMRRGDDYELDDDEIIEHLQAAHELAPHLPYAQLELSGARLTSGFDSAYRSIGPYLRGVQQVYRWLDTRVGWTFKGVMWLLMALGVAFGGFLLGQLLRYFGIAAYDGTRILPPGFSSTQTVIVLVALVLVPGLLLQSPLVSVLLLLLLVIPFQQLNERVVTIGFLAVLAALPWVDDRLGEFIAYPDSDAQRLLHAHYHHCDEDFPRCDSDEHDCHDQWFQQLDDIAGDDTTGVARYVERLAVYRSGDDEQLDQLAEWLDEHTPHEDDDRLESHWLNLRGMVAVARGDVDDSLELFEQAADASDDSPAPWFNQARAHQLLDNTDASSRAMRTAYDRDMAATSLQAQLRDRHDRNSFLMVQPVDSTTIWQAHGPDADDGPSLIEPVWTVLAGEEIELQFALWFGLGGIVVVLLTFPLYRARLVSSPCPKCGLARDPSETDQTGHHYFCLPCYQTFVSGASLEYQARVHSEATLGRRDRLQRFLRRALSAVTPGIGHVLGGHAIRGVLTFAALFTGIFMLVYPSGPLGVWRGPFELFEYHWAGQSLLAWVLVAIGVSVGLTGLWRGIHPTRKDDRPSDGKAGR